MLDPPVELLYWGSKCIFHTVCWGANGCEWGTTSVYFGITAACFIPKRLPVFAIKSLCQHQFLYLSKIILDGQKQHLRKISCWFKNWMQFRGQVMIMLKHLPLEVLLSCPFDALLGVTDANMQVANDHWSVRLTCRGMCGMEVWKFVGAICVMV